MGRIRIRKANESDQAQIISIQNSYPNVRDKVFFKDFSHNDLCSNNNTEIWTAIIDMEVVGFSYVWSSESLPKEGVFKSFSESIPEQKYKGKALQEKKMLIHSPIYLCKNWQKGVYKSLLEKIKTLKKHDYDLGLIFIHFDDFATLNEHIKELNMGLLRPFFHNEEGYNVAYFKLDE